MEEGSTKQNGCDLWEPKWDPPQGMRHTDTQLPQLIHSRSNAQGRGMAATRNYLDSVTD